MRTAFLVSSLVALAAAQSVDLSLIHAAPAVIVKSAPVTGTSQQVAAQDSAQQSSVGAAAVQANPNPQEKRDIPELEKRDGNCAPQPNGTGPAVHNPDTPDAFLKNSYFTAAAYSAPIPQGYVLNFTNLQASTSTSSYMGYTTLDEYDTYKCASLCTAATGCTAFNLYFERDPTLDPNAQACPNPPSLTNIKCVFWGVPVSAATATNAGQYRDDFHVVIAGSNGYNAIALPPAIAGFLGPLAMSGAPNIPADPVTSTSTYIGAEYFSFGTAPGQVQYYSTEACVSACSAQTEYNFAHPPSSGANPTVCNHVIAYMLTNSTSGVPQGVYCAMFTESWDKGYGTVSVVQDGQASLGVEAVYAYTNNTYSGSYNPICTSKNCKTFYNGGNCGGWGAGTC